jgi:hypothetical protein
MLVIFGEMYADILYIKNIYKVKRERRLYSFICTCNRHGAVVERVNCCFYMKPVLKFSAFRAADTWIYHTDVLASYLATCLHCRHPVLYYYSNAGTN